MKIALYIEDGLEQIVLTAETKTEKAILGKLHDGSRTLQIHSGGFYPCRGGWTRHTRQYPHMAFVTDQQNDDESTIIVLRESVRPDPSGCAEPSEHEG